MAEPAAAEMPDVGDKRRRRRPSYGIPCQFLQYVPGYDLFLTCLSKAQLKGSNHV
jgi:hypothetical protein